VKSDTIASAARRWDAARIEAKRLRKERASFECIPEAAVFDAQRANDTNALLPYPKTIPPCWKTFEPADEFGGSTRAEYQCDACVERARINDLYRVATRKRGDAQRALIQLLAAERKRCGFDEAYQRKADRK